MVLSQLALVRRLLHEGGGLIYRRVSVSSSLSFLCGVVSIAQSSGIVLLVEDEPLVRLFVADLLSDEQFHVVEAANAEEAFTILKANLQVDVLLTDVEMPPGANGYELARQVHQAWPLLEILVTSGREWPQPNSLPPGAAFLSKPYSNTTLVSHVRAAVGRTRVARATQAEQSSTDRTGVSVPKAC